MKKETNSLIDDFTEDDEVKSDLSFWDYKAEKEVIGLFKEWAKDSFGEHAVIQTETDAELHLPNLVALNGKIKSKDATTGSKVKIVYLGDVKSPKSGRTYSDFKVFVK